MSERTQHKIYFEAQGGTKVFKIETTYQDTIRVTKFNRGSYLTGVSTTDHPDAGPYSMYALQKENELEFTKETANSLMIALQKILF